MQRAGRLGSKSVPYNCQMLALVRACTKQLGLTMSQPKPRFQAHGSVPRKVTTQRIRRTTYSPRSEHSTFVRSYIL